MSYAGKRYFHRARDETIIYLCSPLGRLDRQYSRLRDDESGRRLDVQKLDERRQALVAAEKALANGDAAAALALMHRELTIQGFREW